MLTPYMRWHERTELFRDVALPSNLFTGRLFAIGSCFAENVVVVLKRRGVDARLSHAGLFYTPGTIARHLAALVDNESSCTVLEAESIAYAPQLASKVRGSAQDLIDQFKEAVAADRTAVRDADTVVMTLGLNEQIVLEHAGERYLCRQLPPPPFLKRLEGSVTVHPLTVEETKSALRQSVDLVRRLNANASILFTVSPVPLHATFQKLDIRVANSRSKYTLYAALHEFLQERPDLHYFPSFEHAQQLQSRPGFWETDERHVTSAGVGRLMQFLAEYAGHSVDVSHERPQMALHDLKKSIKKVVKRGLDAIGR